ncbi:hypothetical protein F2Q68_00000362 [Brassica cretica]|uniref:Uncharacterized protein n=1 Tax=Brassica cretica TaxID=69181 RepID=A0A8S9J7Z9_BRACR|nr:hypothetical protein F2Q68_00000362 [Brassica cretica]
MKTSLEIPEATTCHKENYMKFGNLIRKSSFQKFLIHPFDCAGFDIIKLRRQRSVSSGQSFEAEELAKLKKMKRRKMKRLDKLKNWQLRRLAYALKAGRRETSESFIAYHQVQC